MINEHRLEGAIRTAGYTQNKLAAEMKITPNTLSIVMIAFTISAIVIKPQRKSLPSDSVSF